MNKERDRKTEYMAKRHEAHGSHRKASQEFGKSKSTFHRAVKIKRDMEADENCED